MLVVVGSTDVSVDVRALTVAGAALTGKVAADFSAWYRRDGAKTAIELSDLDALTDAHSDGGLKEIGDGWYRLDVPDAAFAAGANRAAIGGTVAGGVLLSAPVVIDACGAGSGSRDVEITCQVSGVPVDGVCCEVFTDEDMMNRIAEPKYSDATGLVSFNLDPGDYYLRRQLSGYSFTNPQSFTVDP